MYFKSSQVVIETSPFPRELQVATDHQGIVDLKQEMLKQTCITDLIRLVLLESWHTRQRHFYVVLNLCIYCTFSWMMKAASFSEIVMTCLQWQKKINACKSPRKNSLWRALKQLLEKMRLKMKAVHGKREERELSGSHRKYCDSLRAFLWTFSHHFQWLVNW